MPILFNAIFVIPKYICLFLKHKLISCLFRPTKYVFSNIIDWQFQIVEYILHMIFNRIFFFFPQNQEYVQDSVDTERSRSISSVVIVMIICLNKLTKYPIWTIRKKILIPSRDFRTNCSSKSCRTSRKIISWTSDWLINDSTEFSTTHRYGKRFVYSKCQITLF